MKCLNCGKKFSGDIADQYYHSDIACSIKCFKAWEKRDEQ